jgi:hypothetical protein
VGGRQGVCICARATVESSPRGRAGPPARNGEGGRERERESSGRAHPPARPPLCVSLSLSPCILTHLRHGSLLTRLRKPSRKHITLVYILGPDTLVPERRSQFADKVENAYRLNVTHCLSYSFPYIWENWEIRK